MFESKTFDPFAIKKNSNHEAVFYNSFFKSKSF